MSEYEAQIYSVILILRAMYGSDLDEQAEAFTPPRQSSHSIRRVLLLSF